MGRVRAYTRTCAVIWKMVYYPDRIGYAVCMSESSKVWKVIKRTAASEWQRIENRTQSSVPDCLVLSQNGRVSWVEGKYMPSWPKNLDTSTSLGLDKAQVLYLKRWCRLGGRAWLLARIGDDWLLVHGSQVEHRLTKRVWLQRATKVWEGKLDVKQLEGFL